MAWRSLWPQLEAESAEFKERGGDSSWMVWSATMCWTTASWWSRTRACGRRCRGAARARCGSSPCTARPRARPTSSACLSAITGRQSTGARHGGLRAHACAGARMAQQHHQYRHRLRVRRQAYRSALPGKGARVCARAANVLPARRSRSCPQKSKRRNRLSPHNSSMTTCWTWPM